jgi:hypothetical protein
MLKAISGEMNRCTPIKNAPLFAMQGHICLVSSEKASNIWYRSAVF